MNAILKYFLKIKIVSSPNCDKALELYTKFLEEVKRVNSHELRHFKTWESNLDEFYLKKHDIDIRPYGKFAYVLKKILTLSHRQAAEREFSLGKSSLQVKIKEESIVVKKTVRYNLLANKVDFPSFEICKKLIIAYSTAHSKYKQSLEKTTNSSAKVLEKERRKAFKKELKELEGKGKKLIRTCESVGADSINYSFKAETKSDLDSRKLYVEANSLKKRQMNSRQK